MIPAQLGGILAICLAQDKARALDAGTGVC
jgi:hypothetical protein